MALHHDLLEQAEHLVAREPKQPRQASLRRAVSAAYYALFHLLTAEAARRLAPDQRAGLRAIVGRAFVHGDMKAVCRQFAAQRLVRPLDELVTLPIEPALILVAATFVELQEARHIADYDLSRSLDRLAARERVRTARRAFAEWHVVRQLPNANVFLLALLLQRQWGLIV